MCYNLCEEDIIWHIGGGTEYRVLHIAEEEHMAALSTSHKKISVKKSLYQQGSMDKYFYHESSFKLFEIKMHLHNLHQHLQT